MLAPSNRGFRFITAARIEHVLILRIWRHLRSLNITAAIELERFGGRIMQRSTNSRVPECSTGKSRSGSASHAGGLAKFLLTKGTEHR